MFYSKQTGGFYSREIHGDNIPSDAVEVSAEDYLFLIEGQSSGKIILPDENGFPQLVDKPVPTLTYQEKLLRLNTEYQKDVDSLNKAFSLAILFDGSVEEAKKAAVRSQYNTRKQKYLDDLNALKAEQGE